MHRGWTQEEFAERQGYSLKFTQRIEAGRENLTIKTLANLAQHLSADLAVLFRKPRSEKPKPGRPRKRTGGTKMPSR
jgi:transcriptional regulator with XRE-family HTH domain